MAQGKVYSSAEAALADVSRGATVLVGGFMGWGVPETLLSALGRKGVDGLTCIATPFPGQSGAANDSAWSRLISQGQVRKLISPYPFDPAAEDPAAAAWQSGSLEVEVVPQGILAERLRAGGAGLGGVFLPAEDCGRFAEGKERRTIDGRECVMEPPLRADFALLQGHTADTLGNLVYQGSRRNWGPVIAMAARVSIAEVDRIVERGDLDPERVITPGIFVNRVVRAATSGSVSHHLPRVSDI